MKNVRMDRATVYQGPELLESLSMTIREFKHDYENNNQYDTGYWSCFRSRCGKFDLSFRVASA